MKKKTVLIIGGTSGLGLEIANKLNSEGKKVIITGREYTGNLSFIKLNIQKFSDIDKIESLLDSVGEVDELVIAAGYFLGKKIGDNSNAELEEMFSIGLTFPITLVNEIMKKQGVLKNLIIITSTSQWTPRLIEPIYTAVKSGIGMFANSVSLDERMGKVLVVGPSGMKTNFWKNGNTQLATFLEPEFVASEVIRGLEGDFKYKFVKVLRGPIRVNVEEMR